MATGKSQGPKPKHLSFAVFTWPSHYSNNLDKATQTFFHVADAAVSKNYTDSKKDWEMGKRSQGKDKGGK